MTRELSSITDYDLQILELGKKVLKVVKTKKQWKGFVNYMSVYYKNYDKIPTKNKGSRK